MRRRLAVLFLLLAGLGAWAWASQTKADWTMNASIIEACSCPMFCQCYFNAQPSEHHGGHSESHFCRFNNAFKVNRGHYGAVRLDGAKFWVAGDLGAEFADGEMDWAVLTFDPAVSKEQREGIRTVLGALYPVKWKSFSEAADASMEWTQAPDRSVARLDGGKVAEVVLTRPAMSANGSGPVVIQNLKYWGAPRNDGFVLMPNEVEAYRAGERPFEFKGTNGFMITFDISSQDAVAATGM